MTVAAPQPGGDAAFGDVHELAQQLRVDSIRCSTRAGSGHPTSSMSAADVVDTARVLARELRDEP